MRTPRRIPTLLLLTLLLSLAAAAAIAPAHAAPPLRTWSLGGTGTWNTPGNWTPFGVPLGGDSVHVPLGLGSHTLTLDVDAPGLNSLVQLCPLATFDLNGHSLSAGATSTTAGTLLASGASQGFYGPLHTLAGSHTSILNGAVLNVNSAWQNDGQTVVHSSAGANPAEWRVINYITLSGTGDLRLADAVNASITSPAGYSLTHGAGHLIHGAGRITLPLVNHGTITADDAPGATLSLENTTWNDGTLRAASGARLLLNAGVDNSGGLLLADGGNVELNGGTVSNGVFRTTGTSLIETSANSTIGGSINLAGALNVNSGHVLNCVAGSLADSGTIVVHPSGASPSAFRLSNYLTLGGPGSLLLNDQALASLDSPAGYALTHGAGHTIHGAGSVALAMTNHGLVSADVAGQTLALSNAVSNDGTLQATGGGILVLQGNTVGNSGSVAADGGDVRLENEIINGGHVSSGGSSVVIAAAGTSSLNNVSLSGTLQVASGAVLATQGTIANGGIVQVRPPAAAGTATLRLNGYATYQGNGSIQLTHASESVFDSPATFSVTQNTGHTLHGTGRVTLPLINHGLVSADVSGQPLTVSNSVTNDGTLQATAGGTLLLAGAAIGNTGGTIRANGGDVQLSAEFVSGGTLSRTGSSVVAITGSSALENVSNTGVVQVNGGTMLATTGTIANAGHVVVRQPAGAGTATLRLTNYATYSGAGAIDLTDASQSLIDSPPGFTLTNAAGHTVRGTGLSTLPVANHGLVSADVPGQALTMSNVIVNDGAMRAVDGGILRLAGAALQNAGGTLAAITGDVRIANSDVGGGTFASGAGNSVTFDDTSHVFTGFLNTGQTRVNGGVMLSFAGATVTDSGTVQVRSPGDTAAAILRLDNYVSLAGNGALVLTHGSQSIVDSPAGFTLTNLPPHTIRGAGVLACPLFNNGLLVADQKDSLLQVTSGSLLLTGIQAAANGGRLAFATNTPHYGALALTGGTWQAGANSTIQFPAADIRNIAATVILDGAGSELVSADSSVSALRRLVGIGPGGTLALRGGRMLGTTAGLASSGVVDVGPHSVLTVGTALPGGFQMDSNATYVAAIAGRNAGEWGRIVVNGSFVGNGRLRVRILDGFVPVLTDTFEIMTFSGSRSGGFAAVDSQRVAPHVVMNHVWRANRLLLVARYSGEVTDVPPSPGNAPLPIALAFSARGGAGEPARLELALPNAAALDVALFDVSGRRVASLAHGAFVAGRWSWTWGDAPERAASGVYFARARVAANGVTRELTSRFVLWR